MAEEKKKRGRPFNSKDKIPRVRTVGSKKNQAMKEAKTLVEFDQGSILNHLSGEVRKLYKEYSKTYAEPIHALQALSKTMTARHRIAAMSELTEWETKKQNAKQALKDVEATGQVSGKQVTPSALLTRKRNLKREINAKLTLSSQLTTLECELIKLQSEIDRIQSGRSDTSISIYQIMSGKGDKVQNEHVKAEIFDFPKELMEDEDIDDIDI